MQAPLAVSQEPMVWHEQLVPGSFNLPCLVRRCRGALDVDALGRAFDVLARRHEPLRTTFAVANGAAVQVVAGDGPGLRVVEVPDELAVADLLADATSRPFDLSAGPLFDPSLLRLGADDHLMVVRLHHTAFDDWSVDVFRRQLSALYAGSALPDPPARFSQVAARRQSFLAGPGGDEHRAWWRAELAGAPLAVQLPIGGSGGGGPGDPVHVPVPASLASAVRSVAPALRATPFMTVLAAFAMVVGRVTSQDDLVLGTVTAHRTSTDVEPLLGCFTKKVPVRLRVDGSLPFGELVNRARAALLGALAHQDVGFDAALSESLARPAAEHGVVPQVAVVVQAETPRRARLSLPGITVEPYEAPAAARRERHFSAGTDEARSTWGDGAYLGTFLLLSLAEDEDGMSLIARGVFDRPLVRALLAQFLDVLGAALTAPDRTVADLVAGLPATAPGSDVVDLRGFRVSRSRLEAALATCPGVAQVTVDVHPDGAGEPRLVASVVPAAGGPPVTLEALRAAQWSVLPGTPWPSALDSPAGPPPLPEHPHPVAGALLPAWPGGHGLRDSYWLDFSFLPAVAAARAAGFPITDEQIARNRTVETLAADVASTLE